jgi:hypothetical protein
MASFFVSKNLYKNRGKRTRHLDIMEEPKETISRAFLLGYKALEGFIDTLILLPCAGNLLLAFVD